MSSMSPCQNLMPTTEKSSPDRFKTWALVVVFRSDDSQTNPLGILMANSRPPATLESVE